MASPLPVPLMEFHSPSYQTSPPPTHPQFCKIGEGRDGQEWDMYISDRHVSQVICLPEQVSGGYEGAKSKSDPAALGGCALSKCASNPQSFILILKDRHGLDPGCHWEE